MDNLQNFTRQKFFHFLLTLFFLTLLPKQSIPSQNRRGVSPKNEIKTLAQEAHIDFELPFRQCWNFTNDNIFFVASDNESSLFLSFLGGRIISLDYSFGKKKWESDLGGEIISPLYISGKDVYIVTRPVLGVNDLNNDGRVYGRTANETINETTDDLLIRSINKETGLTNWQTKISAQYNSQSGSEFLYIFKSSLLLLNNKGRITAFDRITGQILWDKENNLILSTKPLSVEDKVILQTSERQLIIASLSDGSLMKTIRMSDSPTALYYDKESKKLILGNQNGVTYPISGDFSTIGTSPSPKKREWEFRNGAQVSDINLTPKGLLVSSLDNFVYLISKNSGNLIWKKRLGGRISAEPLIIGNYAVITTVSEPSASILDLDTGKLVNKILLADENFFSRSPLQLGNRLIFATQKGIFAFSNSVCFKD